MKQLFLIILLTCSAQALLAQVLKADQLRMNGYTIHGFSNDPTLADSATIELVTEAAVKAALAGKGRIDTLYKINDTTMVVVYAGGAEDTLNVGVGNSGTSLSATQILDSLKTVDGAGSGLDADLLDGQQGTYYLALGNATGTLAATNGGTGQTSYAVGDLLFANTTTTLSKLADVATGNVLLSGGVGVAPSYGKVGLTTHMATGTANRIMGFDGSGNPAQLRMSYGYKQEGNVVYRKSTIVGSKRDISAGNSAYGQSNRSFYEIDTLVFDSVAHLQGNSTEFFGGVFDGRHLWFSPYRSSNIVRLDPGTQEMLLIAHGGSVNGYNDATFDGEKVWFGGNSPTDSILVINVNTLEKTRIGYSSTISYLGSCYDGKYVYFAPYAGTSKILRVDALTLDTTEIATGESVIGGGMYNGAVFDGRYVWMFGYAKENNIKYDTHTETVELLPHGGGATAFRGGFFDGQYVWASPSSADFVLKYDPVTNDTTHIPHGNLSGTYIGAVFDGQSAWLIPLNANNFVKINTETNQVNNVPNRFGANAFGGAIFNGEKIYLAPLNNHFIYSFRPPELGEIGFFTSEDLSVGGDARIAGNIIAAAGTASLPSINFKGDSNTGIYAPAADNWSVATGGTQRFLVNSTGLLSSGNIRVADGTAAAPAFTFTNDLNTGFFRPAADIVAASVNGVEGARLDVNGLQIGTAGSKLGQLRLTGNTSGTVTVQPAAAAGTWTLTLPTTAGSSGQVLQTNGSGVTSWATPTTGITGSGSSGRVTYWDGAGSVTSSANFLFASNRLDVLNSAGPSARLGYSGAAYTDLQTSSAGYFSASPTGERFGINTTAPNATFQIQNNGTATQNIINLDHNSTTMSVGEELRVNFQFGGSSMGKIAAIKEATGYGIGLFSGSGGSVNTDAAFIANGDNTVELPGYTTPGVLKVNSSGVVSVRTDTIYVTLNPVPRGTAITQTAGFDFDQDVFVVPEAYDGKACYVDYALLSNTATTGSLTIGIRENTTTNSLGTGNQAAGTFSGSQVRAYSSTAVTLAKGEFLFAEVNPAIAGTLDGAQAGLVVTLKIIP